MDSSRMSSEMSLTVFPSDRCGRISGLLWRCWTSGQDGDSRTAGQSWCRLQEPGPLSAWCGVGSTDGPSVASLAQHLLEESHRRFIHRSTTSTLL